MAFVLFPLTDWALPSHPLLSTYLQVITISSFKDQLKLFVFEQPPKNFSTACEVADGPSTATQYLRLCQEKIVLWIKFSVLGMRFLFQVRRMEALTVKNGHDRNLSNEKKEMDPE